MTLKYKLQEGFIDVRVHPKDVVTGDQRYVILFPCTLAKYNAGINVIETNQGKMLIDNVGKTAITIDNNFLQNFGVSEETIVNLNVPAALQALTI